MASSGFITYKTITLDVADQIASIAIETAKKNGFNPMAVCVLDATGVPIVTKRMDHCTGPAYATIAQHKANTCIRMKKSSRAYGDKYLPDDATPGKMVRILSQIHSNEGEIASFPGGISIKCKETGQIIGAVGASGAAGDEDEYCCLQGVWKSSIAEEIVTEPADHSCTTVKVEE
eukprot:CAMPEP_0194052360 /NCGR_PEP_ID=MMETSP0009_2-20130614/45182_1 /TAXON_ID=210454 /ORGANISM="Grammatophora oceanica, Strain CCMP 410" /LENGTH=174 /DNA_ID=CAMNT_0038699909 /DNA_START=167 /DNA_END=691 /DNA_ORIENTATION=-